MLVAIVSAGAVLLIAAACLVYLNWGSEALKSNGVTAAVVGLAGLLATLWFSLKPPDDRVRRLVRVSRCGRDLRSNGMSFQRRSHLEQFCRRRRRSASWLRRAPKLVGERLMLGREC